jgi:hypothetical protein
VPAHLVMIQAPWWRNGSRALVRRCTLSTARPLARPTKPGVGSAGSRRPVRCRSDGRARTSACSGR